MIFIFDIFGNHNSFNNFGRSAAARKCLVKIVLYRPDDILIRPDELLYRPDNIIIRLDNIIICPEELYIARTI